MAQREPQKSEAFASQRSLRILPRIVFASRWLQVPLYLGLIAAQCIFTWQFLLELWHLLAAAAGDQSALLTVSQSKDPVPNLEITQLNETLIMLTVLALIDIVMLSNLVFMIVVGGYETFVSRLRLEKHPDQPHWLGDVNTTVLKVKLAMAIIGISSIHLLKTFINADDYSEKVLLWQTVIHVVFLLSAIAIAYTDKLLHSTPPTQTKN